MADNREDFEVWLKSRYDGDAMKAAQADFKRTQDAAKKTDDSLEHMGYSAKALKTELMSLLAFTAVIAQFREGFEQVQQLEQAMNQLERAAKRNGDNFDAVKGKIVGMAESLKKAAGVDDDAAIKGMVALYNATGDVANATALARLAADVYASGTLPTYEAALDAVTGAAQGKTRALVQLKLATDEDSASTLTAQEALDRIQKSFGGAANGAKGLKVEIDRLSEAWEDVRNNVIESGTPVVSAWIKFAKTWVAIIATAADMIGEVLHGVFLGFMKTGDALGMLLKGNVAGAKRAMTEARKDTEEMFDALVQSAKVAADKIDGIWSGTGGGGITADKPKAIGGAKGKGGGGDMGQGQFGPDDKLFLDYQKKIETARKLEAQLAKDRQAAYLKYVGYEESKEKWLERLSDEKKKADADELQRATKLAKEEEDLAKHEARVKEEAAIASAGAVIGAMGAVFGESKALASADAAINTWAGAARALKDYPAPYSYIIAAATVVAGLARVAQINSTEPSTSGKGFDDPRNDAAARIGGRRWAADMIGEFTGGVSEGWAQGMRGVGRGNTTYDNRSTVNLHMNVAGFLDPNDQHQMAKFARSLAVVNKTVEGQRRTARTSR